MVAFTIFSLSKPKGKFANLQVEGSKLKVEIADTTEKVITGLSFRESLEENRGMYFVLGKREGATFWMIDMHFPLDIIWIDSGKIIGIEKNALPPSKGITPTFTSPAPVTNVLEVNAGWSEKNRIQENASVNLVK